MPSCFHCGLPAEPNYTATLDGEEQSFCCLGCQLVAKTIVAGGLQQFYQYRDDINNKADARAVNFQAFDLPDVQQEFVEQVSSDSSIARLSISNIACAACAWLIENYLNQLVGVESVNVNVASHRCSVRWRPSQLKLSDIFSALHEIGYQAFPYSETGENERRKKEERNALLRLGVAGLGMMQVGMVAVALHAGALQGMDAHWQLYLRWISLIFATPVILFSAQPFFTSAWRALKLRYLNMDVPVALALLLAYGASVWATLFEAGEVYFDSVSMFTFFLLAGRFFEMRVRHSSAFASEKLTHILPLTFEQIKDNKRQTLPIKAMQVGDLIWVAAGDVFPCDAQVIEGASSADESIVSGESLPQAKQVGDIVLAGSINNESALVLKVLRVGRDTQLSQVENLVDRAASLKPKSVTMADSFSSYFVAAVIVIAVAVASVWYFIAPEKAFWIALSVLVVTCPCALSLATPTALTAGILRLRFLGVVVTSQHFIETLARVRHAVFDKTGTLTSGKIQVKKVLNLTEQLKEEELLHIVAALESSSRHPIAEAFADISPELQVEGLLVHAGSGVEGHIQQNHYRFGKKEFASTQDTHYPSAGLWQLLSKNDTPIAWVLFEDTLRQELPDMQRQLQTLGLSIELLSGDRQTNVESFARANGIASYRAQAMPQDKLEHIEKLQSQGQEVLMVGDGINDVPVLKGADVSLAMASATRLAQTHADAVLVNENLNNIASAIVVARRVKATIRQNLMWALLYNGVALPLAALGWIPPYLAAIGMSASSLLVVINAWRLKFVRPMDAH